MALASCQACQGQQWSLRNEVRPVTTAEARLMLRSLARGYPAHQVQPPCVMENVTETHTEPPSACPANGVGQRRPRQTQIPMIGAAGDARSCM
jgi:hypothetical protein